MFVAFHKTITRWEELWGNITGYYHDSEEPSRIKTYSHTGVTYMFI